MTEKSDAEQFLNQFKIKLKVFDVIYVGRSKNAQALLDMEMVPAARTKILENLETDDYCEGPLEATIHGAGNMWVFGKEVSGNEIYIKIAMGQPSRSVICISFHKAAQPLQYPFKES